MKTPVHLRKNAHVLFMSAAIATTLLLCSVEQSYARQAGEAGSLAVSREARQAPAQGLRDTILISKVQSSRKHKVKLYPNADHQVLFFSASGEAGRVYQLYLFDMDGKLSKQIQIRNKETTVLTNIIKGSYLFEVFSDDERIENGSLTIK